MSSPKLKVLAIVPSGFCFGLQEITINLFANLSSGIEPNFLVTRWNDGEFIKMLNRYRFGYVLSWLGMFSRKLDWYNIRMSLHALKKLPRLYYDLHKLYSKTKPDIIYFANHHELLLLLPFLFFSRIKVVCHMHDPPPAIPFQKITFRLYGKLTNRFIAISNDVRTRLIDLGCDGNKISVVHNGVRVPPVPCAERKSTFKPRFSWPDDSFIVGITGQMTATKGHEDLLEAISLAVAKIPRIRLVIGGKVMEPLFSKLNNLIVERHLSHIVSFSGWAEDVTEFYEAIDLYVLASRHDEGYGLVVAEAMAFGIPVVITRSGGATEIVEDGVNGFIVPKSNIDMMAERILRLSNTPNIYSSFGLNARKRIESDFSIETSANRFEEVLRSVM